MTTRRQTRPLSSAQAARQSVRKAGKYANFPECQGRCGRRVNPYEYYSHGLTDLLDADGRYFADAGIRICEQCCRDTQDQTSLAQWGCYVAANLTRRALPIPDYVWEWTDRGAK
jgi:hypothetical protein